MKEANLTQMLSDLLSIQVSELIDAAVDVLELSIFALTWEP